MIVHSIRQQFEQMHEKLRQDASERGSSRIITQVPAGVSPDDLTGIYGQIWDHLEREGLYPGIFSTTNPPSVLGRTYRPNEPVHYIFASWNAEAPEQFQPLAQELRCLRDAAAWRAFAEKLPVMKARIESAKAEGREQTVLLRFSGLDEPTALFPFDGNETTLPELGQLTWRYLYVHGMTPVFGSRACSHLTVRGLGRLMFNGQGRIYSLSAAF